MKLTEIVAVAAGGALGAVGRYALGGWIARSLPGGPFPVGTLSVNVVGCFAIGVVGGWLSAHPEARPGWSLFVMTGLLGGFTTFSAFGNEVWLLARDGSVGRAFGLVLLHVIAGLTAVALGYATVGRAAG